MLNILACITIAENEKGELGVGLDLQLNEETLKKLQELLPQLAEDVSNMTIDDVNKTMGAHNPINTMIVEKEIQQKLSTIDIEEIIKEDLLARDIHDNILTEIFDKVISSCGVPKEYLQIPQECDKRVLESMEKIFKTDTSKVDAFKEVMKGVK